MSIEKRSILKYIKCVEFESDSFYGIKEIKDLLKNIKITLLNDDDEGTI